MPLEIPFRLSLSADPARVPVHPSYVLIMRVNDAGDLAPYSLIDESRGDRVPRELVSSSMKRNLLWHTSREFWSWWLRETQFRDDADPAPPHQQDQIDIAVRDLVQGLIRVIDDKGRPLSRSTEPGTPITIRSVRRKHHARNKNTPFFTGTVYSIGRSRLVNNPTLLEP